jgi:hypothetical protein
MFEKIHRTARNVHRGIVKVKEEAIKYSTTDMEDMNIEQMLFGKNADGEEIGEYRSESYAAMKQSMNSRPPAMVPDLRLTGAFHSGMKVDYTGSDLTFTSTDSKTSKLTAKYGDNIFGLTTANQENIQNDVIFPIITDWIGQQMKSL